MHPRRLHLEIKLHTNTYSSSQHPAYHKQGHLRSTPICKVSVLSVWTNLCQSWIKNFPHSGKKSIVSKACQARFDILTRIANRKRTYARALLISQKIPVIISRALTSATKQLATAYGVNLILKCYNCSAIHLQIFICVTDVLKKSYPRAWLFIRKQKTSARRHFPQTVLLSISINWESVREPMMLFFW